MAGELSLRLLRRTNLDKIYNDLLVGNPITARRLSALLQVAIVFLNSNDAKVKAFGYRIILLYAINTNDLLPLYDVSINLGYIPIAKLIRRLKQTESEAFFNSLMSAYEETFSRGAMFLTEEQERLFDQFLENDIDDSLVVVAPTSYGKSELILATLARFRGSVCILVPTKALIAQTRRRIVKSGAAMDVRPIVTHPDMIPEDDSNLIGVMTQERMMRALQKNSALKFDLIFVDEAHNLLESGERSTILASVLIILNKRNPACKIRYLTPFLVDHQNIEINHIDNEPALLRISESIKSERIFCFDFARDGALDIYDQYTDEFVPTSKTFDSIVDMISVESGRKNIVYVNKPSSAEKTARGLAGGLDTSASADMIRAAEAIEKHVHKEYFLAKCLRKGVVYHHGAVPDQVKLYVEHIFSSMDEIRYLATTSTLLEGVNVPADRLFILDNKKGPKLLSPSQLKNLIGRACRFREVFSDRNFQLDLLSPSIYIARSEFTAQTANLQNFVSARLRVDRKVVDSVENVLLSNSTAQSDRVEALRLAEKNIENIEPGTLAIRASDYARTLFGSICYKNSISDIPISESELSGQSLIDSLLTTGVRAESPGDVLDIFVEIFLPFIKNESPLYRLHEPRAVNFYSMFLEWRSENKSLGEMIGNFLGYWRRESTSDPLIYVGARWGEVSKPPSFGNSWVDIRSKSEADQINLAIVRIKEEQDIVDHQIMKFVEAINDFGLIEADVYEAIKWGTADKESIALIKHGLSPTLSSALLARYRSFVFMDEANATLAIDPAILIPFRMQEDDDILLFELDSHIKN